MGQGFARVPQDSTFPPAAPRGRQLGMGSSISTAVRTLYRLPSYAARPRFIDSSTVSHSPAGCRPRVPSRLVFEQKEKKLASRPRPRSQPPQPGRGSRQSRAGTVPTSPRGNPTRLAEEPGPGHRACGGSGSHRAKLEETRSNKHAAARRQAGSRARTQPAAEGPIPGITELPGRNPPSSALLPLVSSTARPCGRSRGRKSQGYSGPVSSGKKSFASLPSLHFGGDTEF